MSGKGRPPLQIGTYGSIPIPRQIGPSKYQAKTWFRDADGQMRRVSAVGQTKRAAIDHLKARLLERQVEAEASTVRSSTTVTELAAAWHARHVDRWAVNTRDTYAYVIANQVRPELGAVRLRELRPSVVSRALERIRDTAGPGSAKTAKTVLVGMFDYAIGQDAMPANPARGLRGVTSRGRRKTAVRALTPAEADDLCDRLRSDSRAVDVDLPDLVEWMLGTGARIGEACAARRSVIDVEHGTWEINATLIRVKGAGLTIQERPKTAAGWRVLALPRYCVSMVERRATERRLADSTGVLFGSPHDRALRDPRNTSRDLRDVLDRLGYDWCSSHTFRKTVATRLDDAGLSARDIADQLGHAKPSMTQDVYLGRNVVSSDAARVLDR